MKKAICIMLSLVLCAVLLCACQSAKSDGAEETQAAASAATAEEFAEGYFGVIAGYEPGTAGSSLKQALAAYGAVSFAAEHSLDTADVPAMRDAMLAAWEGLDAGTKTAFDENLFGIAGLIDECFSDYDSVSGVFEDAGVGEKMRALSESSEAKAAWETLFANTLTMGNSDD
ncbi:MAG: hypothetical protein IKD89_05390 [Clostridia bacterium]|nr:hypothetical protein [Clostridia bacterium]